MTVFLEYTNFKDDLIEHKCLCCNKSYREKLYKSNTYKFSNHDNNNFISLLQKGFYPHEDMYDWEKFHETSLPGKEDFYSRLNMEDITDADNTQTKRVFKDFEKRQV